MLFGSFVVGFERGTALFLSDWDCFASLAMTDARGHADGKKCSQGRGERADLGKGNVAG